MEREPTPAEKVLVGFMAGMCSVVIFGILTLGVAVGLTTVNKHLGVACFALSMCIVTFQNHLARRPWLKALSEYFGRAFERMVVSKR